MDFARGKVLIDVLGSQYQAEVVIGFIKAGICELHDVVNINPTSFKYKTSEALSTILPEGKHLQKRSSLVNDSIAQTDDSVNISDENSAENSSDKLYSLDDSADRSENAADTNVGGTEETPFEKALRRSGLAHLIDGEAEALSSSYLHPAKKGLLLHNVIKLRKEPSSEMDLALFLQKS